MCYVSCVLSPALAPLFFCHLSSCLYCLSITILFLSLLGALTGSIATPWGVLRAAARTVGGIPRLGHISEYMRDVLHWLPAQQHLCCRISCIVCHCVQGSASVYMQELFTLISAWSGRRSLRLASYASRGEFSFHKLPVTPDRIGLSRLWGPLLGITFPLICASACTPAGRFLLF